MVVVAMVGSAAAEVVATAAVVATPAVVVWVVVGMKGSIAVRVAVVWVEAAKAAGGSVEEETKASVEKAATLSYTHVSYPP